MAKQVKPTAFPDVSSIENPKILGAFIRAKRTSLALRIEDCAALCGIGINTLSRIENGNDNCTLGATFKVLNGLGFHLSFSDSSNKKMSNVPGQSTNDPWV